MVFVRNTSKNTFLFLSIIFISCVSGIKVFLDSSKMKNENTISTLHKTTDSIKTKKPIVVGANMMSSYLPLLENKRVAIVGNQTSVVFKDSVTNNNYVHLVDTLLSKKINIIKVLAPEHGFRGKADAGELVDDGKDLKTGLPIISLYGKNKKPSNTVLSDIEVVIFDIQDVGVRFYTYISTLHNIMEACAENNVPVLILDRPNPNAHYIDGPTLEIEHSSFLGKHPIPLVHAMSIGEYAKMINGEKWLGEELNCNITVIPTKNYTHGVSYSLPIRPSPNLPNDTAINLYPSLGFFEGTTINAGRGTETQFQVFGSSDLSIETYDFAFIPKPNFGSKYPKHQGEVCYGKDLSMTPTLSEINLSWIIEAYNNSTAKDKFFNTKSFTLHAGTKKLQKQIEDGVTEKEIKATWQKDITSFKEMRNKYLIYK